MLPVTELFDLGETATYSDRELVWIGFIQPNTWLGMARISTRQGRRAGSKRQMDVYLVGAEMRPGLDRPVGIFARQTGPITADRPGLYELIPVAGGLWKCNCLGERGHRTTNQCRHPSAFKALYDAGLITVVEPADDTPAWARGAGGANTDWLEVA